MTNFSFDVWICTEPNEWAVLFTSEWMILFQLTLELFSLACLLIAIVKWIHFLNYNGGIQLNVAQICIILTLVGILRKSPLSLSLHFLNSNFVISG
jgi:hypothetical protein